jgi:hypothetical protein
MKTQRNDEEAVAKSPVSQQRIEERIEELARQGKVRKGTGTVPDELLTISPPKFSSSVLEALLEERESGW